MKQAITINDIANSLQISRNTVSKALNNKYVPDKTKNTIMSKAIELGYKGLNIAAQTNIDNKQKKILLLSSKTLLTANYYVYLARGMESEIESKNLELLQYVFRPYSNFDGLKSYIAQFNVDGIICIEFFNQKIIAEILKFNIPTLFIDFAYNLHCVDGGFDVLLMESFDSVKDVCSKLIERGYKTYSFIGNYKHCRSFYERFLGMKEALFEHGIEFNEKNSILEDSTFAYGDGDALLTKINTFKTFPECFICVNDFVALALLDVLKKNFKHSFANLQVVGFDNTPESRLSNPKLSTINIDKVFLGKTAIKILLDRINSPDNKTNIIYLKSNFISRETTKIT